MKIWKIAQSNDAESIAIQYLGQSLLSCDYVSDNGKEAKGKCRCKCGRVVTWKSCGDVGAVYIYCPNCGLQDG